MKPLLVAVGALVLSLAGQARAQDGFDHPKHARLFPRCESCHPGAARADAAIWPAPASCESCHDGTVARRVTWRPRTDTPSGNLRFSHPTHRDASARTADRNASACSACHQPDGGRWMTVRRTVVDRCLSCHRLATAHLAAPDTACATCHQPLAEAVRLTEVRIRTFPTPPDHRDPGFVATGPRGHGTLTRSAGGAPVAASCATCHARDFCLACHVDGPENRRVQALAPDARSRAIPATLRAPPGHRAAGFDRRHGDNAGRRGERCATCHTRESCLACHAGAVPGEIRALATASPGRATGAVVERRKPATHVGDFSESHGRVASAAERSCAACHARPMCLDCHRPDPAGPAGYHPTGFLSRHPAAAYARETSCSDCHNAQQFCASCHARSGTVAGKRALGVGNYHDGRRFFLFGHGQAARQGLESCVSCHVERDCTTCHASKGGRRFNPHGPGFDPNRLRRKNPETCLACHGGTIPTR